MGKKIFLDKNRQKFGKANYIHISRESFLTFFDKFLIFKKFGIFCSKKLNLGQKVIFLAKIFKNKKLAKKLENIPLLR